MKQVKPVFGLTLVLHQKPGSTLALTGHFALTGAFSREYIISFHAASSFVRNELTDITDVSYTERHTQKDVNKNTYELYPWMIIFCVARYVCSVQACMLTHLHAESQKEPTEV